MHTLRLSKADANIHGHIELTGSKSISNRALIIRALSGADFPIHRLARAKDTELLRELLSSRETVRDAGPAGTTFRFLTAFLATQPGEQILTGTERMKQRPIGVLVEALRKLGANIEYVEREGYPPLRIGEAADFGRVGELTIPASTSSQYVTALLLLAPTLPNGLRLRLEGQVVSRSYIEMTLAMMRYFGIHYEWTDDQIHVPAQAYQPRPFTVEADWSAASYYYSLAALSTETDLLLDGLFADSAQGDAVAQQLYEAFGVTTTFTETGLRLQKAREAPVPEVFEYDFLACPDIAQTLAVTCVGLGVQGLFTGLETLRIKETDRIAALQTELAKVNGFLSKLPPRFSKNADKEYFLLEGKADLTAEPRFATYEDHRMAMAFAPLALLGPILIEEPAVVGKSYPDFWSDFEKLGFTAVRP